MAAVAPVVVTVQLAPATPDTPILLPANDPVVTGTAFLQWRPAPAAADGSARVQLSTFQMIRAFGARCNVSRIPANVAAARNINLLTLRFVGAFWSRLLTELVASGLFARPLHTARDLHERLLALDITRPEELAIVAGDFSAAAAFAVPGGVGGAMAVAARARLVAVRFISLVDVVALEEPTSQAPWELISLCAAALGPVSTQAARSDETSSVQTFCQLFRAQNAAYAASDASLANRLKPFLTELMSDFPTALMAHGVDRLELLEEIQDRAQYLASDHGRKVIAAKRFQLVRPRYAPAPRLWVHYSSHGPSRSPSPFGYGLWAHTLTSERYGLRRLPLTSAHQRRSRLSPRLARRPTDGGEKDRPRPGPLAGRPTRQRDGA